ncbi:uncharacterized protein [Ptychodera flava]|uniref:uncharacterized protein n=1 Tax=Ptychodera flava TaxID=63121 RepID=UPI00396A5B3B
MISDNASTYLSAADEIRKLFYAPDVKRYLANRRVQWSFIPKRAPWFGGFWERMIGLTKNGIKKVLGRAFVTFDELNTIVTEIEIMLNDRPLTYLYTDSEDTTPLSPSHLLQGRPLTGVPHPLYDDDELSDPTYGNSSSLNKRYVRIAQLQEQFWRRWISEYLPALREHHKLNGTTNNVIKVGDVVLVHSDTERRMHWPLAIVEKLNYGKDGMIRSAEIKTTTGLTNRPIVKLYPLEVKADTSTLLPSSNNDTDTILPDTSKGQRRSTRTAAAIARCRIQDQNTM